MDTEKDNKGKLTAKELNDRFARFEVTKMMKNHDKNTDKMLDIYEVASHHYGDVKPDHKCNEKQLMNVNDNTKDVLTCT